MNGIGSAIFLLATLPFATLATAVFAVTVALRRARKIAFPGMAFFIGYGFGNVTAHEQWAESIFRFTLIKPYLEAPIHSLLYSALFVLLSHSLLSIRSASVFRMFLGISMLLVCLPAVFLTVAFGTMALFRSADVRLLIPSLLISPVLIGALFIYCLKNAADFYWTREQIPVH